MKLQRHFVRHLRITEHGARGNESLAHTMFPKESPIVLKEAVMLAMNCSIPATAGAGAPAAAAGPCPPFACRTWRSFSSISERSQQPSALEPSVASSSFISFTLMPSTLGIATTFPRVVFQSSSCTHKFSLVCEAQTQHALMNRRQNDLPRTAARARWRRGRLPASR